MATWKAFLHYLKFLKDGVSEIRKIFSSSEQAMMTISREEMYELVKSGVKNQVYKDKSLKKH